MFTIKFDTQNDAFANGECEREISRVLVEVGRKVRHGMLSGDVIDNYGNRIGSYKYHQDENDAPELGEVMNHYEPMDD